MDRTVAILEDDPGRIAEMRACLGEVLPGAAIVVFDHAGQMIDWLGTHLGDVVLISLDHDLPLKPGPDGATADCGTGRQVSDFLASVPPTCPVIVHSSNDPCASGMAWVLREAGWPVDRVYPCDDLVWVRRDWSERARQFQRQGWIEG